MHVIIGEMSDRASIDTAISGGGRCRERLGLSMDSKAQGLPLVDDTVSQLPFNKKEENHEHRIMDAIGKFGSRDHACRYEAL